jgi:hypothetical protein
LSSLSNLAPLEFSQKKKAVPPKTTTMAKAKRRSKKFFISHHFSEPNPDAKQKSPITGFYNRALEGVGPC